MNYSSEADESLATAAPGYLVTQRFQKIKRKFRVSPETDRKKWKSNIGKQGENPSSTQPSYGATQTDLVFLRISQLTKK